MNIAYASKSITTMQPKTTSPQNQPLPQRGFTIVDLLVVIVVIAILAAVSILTYNGIQKRAGTAAYVAAADTAEKQIRLVSVDDKIPQATHVHDS
ncbi:prepilin-type N-terminal cleavage/methylation domain-containing protein [Leucobacter sp. 1207-22]|uniref:prepilin-type N-terminal cleavage/methylation domain-containing protein n=1 Tax=Leucobacter sp. 1207-22 TaxID=2604456 RepID=UPI0040629A26